MPPKNKKPRLTILNLQQPKRPRPVNQLQREKADRDERSLEAGIKDLDNLFDDWLAMKKRSESNANQVNNQEPELHHEEPEEDLNYVHQGENNGEAPRNIFEYISGDHYRRSQIKEDQQWKHIIRQIFVAFMQCSNQTSQWGDEGKWNHDFQSDMGKCSCEAGFKRFRTVDTVDLTCEWGYHDSLPFMPHFPEYYWVTFS